jgi:hypothetical protein
MWLALVGFTGPPDFQVLAAALKDAAAHVETLAQNVQPPGICRCAGCGKIAVQSRSVDGFPLCEDDAYPGAD